MNEEALMNRLALLGRGWLSLTAAGLLWAGSANLGFAQTGQTNPLRPVTNAGSRPVRPAGAVGTAVRTAEKRTPEAVAHAVSRPERSIATERQLQTSSVAPAAYRRRVGRTNPGFIPGHEDYLDSTVLNGTVTVRQHGNEVIDGGTVYEGGAESIAGEFDSGAGCDGHASGSCAGCGSCGGDGCDQCCLVACPQIPWDDLTIFGGVQGFTGPKNLGQASSFGFHEGFNWGAPVPCFNGCLGMQFGARFTQSNLSGASFSPDTRHQMFLTGGFFRRVDWGLQAGVAFDHLSDDWYTNTDLTQVRAEISWVFPCSHELGFWMANSTNEDTAATRIFVNQIPVDGVATWEATDLYAIFYRHQFACYEGANARLFAGFTGESDGLIGADFELPLTTDLALQTGFAYLVPEEAKGPAGIGDQQESWNVGISLVWYPGCGTANCKSYFAPLLNVADNGSFMVDQLP
jgi:hypothetical protein